MSIAFILLSEGLRMNQNGIVDKNRTINKTGVPSTTLSTETPKSQIILTLGSSL
jgi:hypothetical protein